MKRLEHLTRDVFSQIIAAAASVRWRNNLVETFEIEHKNAGHKMNKNENPNFRSRPIKLYVDRAELENIVDALASHESAIVRKMSTPRGDVFDLERYHNNNALLNRVHAVLLKLANDGRGEHKKPVKRSLLPPKLETKQYSQQRPKKLFSMWK